MWLCGKTKHEKKQFTNSQNLLHVSEKKGNCVQDGEWLRPQVYARIEALTFHTNEMHPNCFPFLSSDWRSHEPETYDVKTLGNPCLAPPPGCTGSHRSMGQRSLDSKIKHDIFSNLMVSFAKVLYRGGLLLFLFYG